jgi:hypothetical protein
MIALLSLGSLGIVSKNFFLTKALSSNKIQVITDKSRYQEIRQQLWANNHHIQHFPEQLPHNSKNVRIAYYSGIGQQGSFLQLRLKNSPHTIQDLLSQYRKTAQHQYQGGDTNNHANLANGVPTTFFYTSDSGRESFPPTYEILVLDAKDRGSPGFKWNHGYSYGVAIDSSASEIVYWSEIW